MRFSLILGVISVSVMTMTGLAGPLDPPAGPIVPTMKTLDEVEPRIPIGPDTTPGDAECVYRITQPGSYYLTENLQGVVGKHGIILDASQVTLDLSGFSVIGPGGTQGNHDGIRADQALLSASIRNGVIQDWTGNGINLCPVQGQNSSLFLQDLQAISNRESGIRIDGESSIIERCTAWENGANGIDASTVIVRLCVSYGNTGYGFSGSGSIEDCMSTSNRTGGISWNYGVVRGCVVYANLGNGIQKSNSGSVIDNYVFFHINASNSAAGIIVTGQNNELYGNFVGLSDFGIRVENDDNFITRNKCRDNGVNWFIVAGNFYGPIIDRTAVTPGGVFGNAASGTLGTSDPNANFSY